MFLASSCSSFYSRHIVVLCIYLSLQFWGWSFALWPLFCRQSMKNDWFFSSVSSCADKSVNFQDVHILDWQLWLGFLFIFEALYNDIVIQHIQQIFAGSKPKRTKEGSTKLRDYSLRNTRLISNCIVRKGALFFVPDYVVFFLLFCLLFLARIKYLSYLSHPWSDSTFSTYSLLTLSSHGTRFQVLIDPTL